MKLERDAFYAMLGIAMRAGPAEPRRERRAQDGFIPERLYS